MTAPTDPRLRLAGRFLFYLAVQLGLMGMAVVHAFDNPGFIYQGF